MADDRSLDSHLLDGAAVAARLRVDTITGLTSAEARRRLAAGTANEIGEGRRRHPLRMFLDQFADFMILVLVAAGVIAGLIGEPQDTAIIAIIVVLNACIGFFQEYRAERAMAALKKLAAPTARVRRDGRMSVIAARDLVPGDLVLLEAGNLVPADLRLVEAVRLRLDEAALTGESAPVEKITGRLHEPNLPLADRCNMTYKGTQVAAGRGLGVVVATAMDTELGRVARLLEEEQEARTPLQRRLTVLGERLALIVMAICAIIFAAGLLRGEPPMLMFLTAVSLAVAAIPEALPAVVTMTLAIGARNMVRKNALIRRLPAVETLGSVTYICSDKTGTLTWNRMRVERIHTGDRDCGSDDPDLPEPLLKAMALNNDAGLDADGRVVGDATEVALYLTAADRGMDGSLLAQTMGRLAECPFDAERKLMTTLHQDGDRLVSYTKGAPEGVVSRCTATWIGHGSQPIDHAGVLAIADRMAADGLRVLALAFRYWEAVPAIVEPDRVEQGLCFLGLVGLLDPPRPEAASAVVLCREAGIVPVMITGDHPATARAIARALGIVGADGHVVTGRELEAADTHAFARMVDEVRVYARTSPEQKIKIVRALQERGEFVAMTGDGVNDAPALKRADIGVAMGRIGTDVAREASHMVLLDDNFATIVAAVREGRRIYDNIRKFVKFAMTGNSGEVWTLFLAPLIGLPLPLLPIHILWVNLVTDGLPGLALAVEPEERRLMRRPPRPPRESIFAHGLWQHIVWVGLLIAGVSLFAQAWAWHTGSVHWQSMVFTVLTLSQMAHVLAIRSERESLFAQGLGSNRPLLGAVLLTFALQMAVLYVPWLQAIFRTEALAAGELLFCLLLSSLVFVAVEAEKWLVRRGLIYRRGGADAQTQG